MRKFILALAGGACVLAAQPAAAQYYYDPYGRPAPRYYQPEPDFWDDGYRAPPRYRRPPPPGYGHYPQQRQRVGQVCITSRGACQTHPMPVGAGCRCYIDGFGPKRGNIQ